MSERPADLPVAGVVLAAGTSSRMEGGFKLLLPWRGGVLVEGPVRAALDAGLDPVVVVAGHRGEEVRAALEERLGAEPTESAPAADAGGSATGARLRVVHAPDFADGLAASLARGLRAVRTETDAAAAAVLVGDEPGIRASDVRTVVAAWRRRASSDRTAASGDHGPSSPPAPSTGGPAPAARARYRDRPGHPVVIPRDAFAELEALDGDRGAGPWLDRNAHRVEEVRLERDAPRDVDTGEDYRAVTGGDP